MEFKTKTKKKLQELNYNARKTLAGDIYAIFKTKCSFSSVEVFLNYTWGARESLYARNVFANENYVVVFETFFINIIDCISHRAPFFFSVSII